MATEYKLSYTAQEIDERLSKIDELENKQDKLTFDSAPTEGSENLITSGGVYEALQNIDVGSGGGEGGNVALTAGDLLEIKDGVIRSTLGDNTGEEIEVFTKFYDAQNLTFGYDEDGKVYTTDSEEHVVDTLPEIGTSLDVYFTPLGEDTPISYNTTVVDFDGIPIACCNSTFSIGDDGVVFAAIDESLPAFMFIFIDDNDKYVGMYAVGDYSGSSVSVGTAHTEPKYVTLPDNALRAGDFIEIKDGTISSTLGKTYTKNLGEVTFFDSDILELVDSGIDEEDPAGSVYYYQDIYQDTFLDKPENEDVPIDIEVKYYPSESDDFVILKGLYAYSYDGKDDCDNYYMNVNAKMGEDDVEVDNPNFPIIEIGASKYSDADEFEIYLMSYGQDITGARIVIDGERVVKTTVKLPKEALDFTVDDEPTEDSENLVTSGAVYEALQNINTSELTGKIEELTGKMEESTGKMIGKNGDGNGSEIFNDYINNVTSGDYSHAEGCNTTASGDYSHAEGFATRASGNYSHAEGSNTTATGSNSHAEGNMTHATGYNSYAEGYMTTASGNYSHAEGSNTEASGNYSHAEGCETTASGWYSHAEGCNTTASTNHAHAEGNHTIARCASSHVQGRYNIEDTNCKFAHIVGNGMEDARSNAHTLDWNGNAWFAGKVYVGGTSMDDAVELGTGGNVDLSGYYTKTEVDALIPENVDLNGYYTKTEVDALIPDVSDFITEIPAEYVTETELNAKGYLTNESIGHGNLIGKTGSTYTAEIFNDYTKNIASASYAHAEGFMTTASKQSSHAEGQSTTASGLYSHAEGSGTTASGDGSHAEGSDTTASGDGSHAEGYKSTASAIGSHAEGYNTQANGQYSHVEGYRTTTSGQSSHAEGSDTTASGQSSHAEGYFTEASGKDSHVQGRYNIVDTVDDNGCGTYAHIVGNGTASHARSNAHTLDWDGNAWYAGSVEATAIILTSPNGTRFKVTVDDNGTLSAAQTTV